MITIDQNAFDNGWNIQNNGEIVATFEGNTPMSRHCATLTAVKMADTLGCGIELDSDTKYHLSLKHHISKAMFALNVLELEVSLA